MNTNPHSDLQIIRPAELCRLLRITVPTLYRWEANGYLPIEKLKLGPNIVGYRRRDVEEWLNSKAEQNNEQSAE